jgi:hypothetical protein
MSTRSAVSNAPVCQAIALLTWLDDAAAAVISAEQFLTRFTITLPYVASNRAPKAPVGLPGMTNKSPAQGARS